MARQDDLSVLRDDLRARMDTCESDQNFAVMGRLLVDVLKQIEELTPKAAGVNVEGSVLSEFEARLRERESGSKTPRRATR